MYSNKFGRGENKDLQLLNATLISLANIYLKKEIQNLSQISNYQEKKSHCKNLQSVSNQFSLTS